MSIFEQIMEAYGKAQFYSYDGCNGFIFDALGYLRWYSPASDFDLVSVPNKAISEFLEGKFEVINSNGFFRLKNHVNKSKEPFELTLSFIVSKNSVEAFRSLEHLAHEVFMTIEDLLGVGSELIKANTIEDSSYNAQVTLIFKTSFYKDDVGSKLSSIYKNEVQNKLNKEFNLKFI